MTNTPTPQPPDGGKRPESRADRTFLDRQWRVLSAFEGRIESLCEHGPCRQDDRAFIQRVVRLVLAESQYRRRHRLNEGLDPHRLEPLDEVPHETLRLVIWSDIARHGPVLEALASDPSRVDVFIAHQRQNMVAQKALLTARGELEHFRNHPDELPPEQDVPCREDHDRRWRTLLAFREQIQWLLTHGPARREEQEFFFSLVRLVRSEVVYRNHHPGENVPGIGRLPPPCPTDDADPEKLRALRWALVTQGPRQQYLKLMATDFGMVERLIACWALDDRSRHMVQEILLIVISELDHYRAHPEELLDQADDSTGPGSR